jgi:hypothetical protein
MFTAPNADKLEFAQRLDLDYPSLRNLFNIPVVNGNEAVYLCGNSLVTNKSHQGLQPKQTRVLINEELDVNIAVNRRSGHERVWRGNLYK